MITQKRKFLYQPSLLNSCICWSWTIIVFLIGVIIWLEITTFQNITLGFFIAFGLLTFIQIHFRRIYVDKTDLRVCTVLNPLGRKLKVARIKDLTTRRNSLSFIYQGKQYKFLLPSNSVIELKDIINADDKHYTQRKNKQGVTNDEK